MRYQFFICNTTFIVFCAIGLVFGSTSTTDDKKYSISISGGVRGGFGGEYLLSTTGDGRKVDLYSHDDNSGRQKWKIVPIPYTNKLYHIYVFGGVSGGFGGKYLLSTTVDGRKVDLYSHDDGSGRQRWKIEKVPNTSDMYHVSISGGVRGGFGGKYLLSTGGDGRKVDLYSHDDGSGRQRWHFVPPPPRPISYQYHSISISGGVRGGFGGEYLLSTGGDGRKVDLYSHDDNSGRQKWKIVPILGTKALYHIYISGGVSGGFGGKYLLSTTRDGRKVDLYSHDDGSGRQRWKIEKISNSRDMYHIFISGGVRGGFGGKYLLSTGGDGRKVDLYSHDDGSGRQKWKIVLPPPPTSWELLETFDSLLIRESSQDDRNAVNEILKNAKDWMFNNDSAAIPASEPLFFVRYAWAILNLSFGDDGWMAVGDAENLCTWSGFQCGNDGDFEITLKYNTKADAIKRNTSQLLLILRNGLRSLSLGSRWVLVKEMLSEKGLDMSHFALGHDDFYTIVGVHIETSDDAFNKLGDTLRGFIGSSLIESEGKRRELNPAVGFLGAALIGLLAGAVESVTFNFFWTPTENMNNNHHLTIDTDNSRYVCLKAICSTIHCACTCGYNGRLDMVMKQTPSIFVHNHGQTTGATCTFDVKDMETGHSFVAKYSTSRGRETLQNIIKNNSGNYIFRTNDGTCKAVPCVLSDEEEYDSTFETCEDAYGPRQLRIVRNTNASQRILDAQDNQELYRKIKDKLDRKRSQTAQKKVTNSWGNINGVQTNVDHIIELQVIAEALADYMRTNFNPSEIDAMLESEEFDWFAEYVAQDSSNLCRISRALNADKGVMCRVHTCRDAVTISNFDAATVRHYFERQWENYTSTFLRDLETYVMALGNADRWTTFVQYLLTSFYYYMYARDVKKKQ